MKITLGIWQLPIHSLHATQMSLLFIVLFCAIKNELIKTIFVVWNNGLKLVNLLVFKLHRSEIVQDYEKLSTSSFIPIVLLGTQIQLKMLNFYPPRSSGFSSSDYYLFWTLSNFNVIFNEVKTDVDIFFSSKNTDFFFSARICL